MSSEDIITSAHEHVCVYICFPIQTYMAEDDDDVTELEGLPVFLPFSARALPPRVS